MMVCVNLKPMQRLILCSLIFACATASAEIYRRIGPDGQVTFSDQPSPGAERIEVQPASSVSLPPLPEQTDEAAAPEEQGEPEPFVYTEFTITSPTPEEGVRANDGNVTVQLSLQPPLQPDHSIVMTVDGEDGEAMKNATSLSIGLTNLSRGRHTVDATVLNRAGEPMVRTQPVSFFVLRVAGG
jgi:hypothetical protein